MEASHLAIILLVIALCLLAAEVFIPSGGMILITALVGLVASIWFAWKAWGSSPISWWSYVATLIVLVPSVVGGVLYWFPRTTMGKRMLLEAPELTEVTPYSDEVQRLSQLVGKRGTTITLLNPGGMVMIDDERYHCESQNLMLEPGEDIEVVGISGTRLIVRSAPPVPELPTEDPPDRQSPQNETQIAGRESAGDATDDDWPLDFEVPHS